MTSSFEEKIAKVKTAMENVFIKKNNTSGLVKNDGTIDTNTYLTTSDASSTYVAKENGKGLFSGSYNDLSNKPTIPSAYVHPSAKQCDYSVNIVTSTDDWSSTPSDSKVPSEKLVRNDIERFRLYSTHSTSTSSAYYVNDYGHLKQLENGSSIYILNTKADNSANATLKITDFDAKPIYTNNTQITAGEWKKNSVNLFVYTTFSSINSGNGAWIMFENMYTHPSTKQCNATIPSSITDLSLDSTYGYPFLTDNDDTIKALNDRLAYDSNSDKVFYDIDGSSSWYELATQNDISTLETMIGNAITYINQ